MAGAGGASAATLEVTVLFLGAILGPLISKKYANLERKREKTKR